MKDDYMKLLVAVAVAAIAGFLLYRVSTLSNNTGKGYEGQSSGTGKGLGWWEGLWDNAANIVDAGGRHTSSFVTSLGNTVSQIIATNKSGEYVYQQYGYSDPKTDYGPYVVAGALVLTAGVVTAVVLSKN